MDFGFSLAANPRHVSSFSDQSDLMDGIRQALKTTVTDLGHPECYSACDLTFIKESAEFGGSGTIIGNGFTIERLTRLSDDWVLAEGSTGGVINIGDIAQGESVALEKLLKPAKAALLLGSKETMQRYDTLDASLADLGRNEVWQAKSRMFDAIGLAQQPLVLRTNDPLIS